MSSASRTSAFKAIGELRGQTLQRGTGHARWSWGRAAVQAGTRTVRRLAALLGVAAAAAAQATPPSNACVSCHTGIEEIHPGYALTCVDCHGGDASATTKERAHVQPTLPVPSDERVRGQHEDLAYQRFVNPSNLRVAAKACGTCHADLVQDVEKSLHATTCGHLGDGFYEHGLTAKRTPAFGVFPAVDADGNVPPGALTAVSQVPPFMGQRPKDRIETHYSDLARKACMHCHLWSEGRAVRGRLAMDGDYRGEGCAACHVTYADDGRSRSADPTIDKLEPGHPVAHRMTTKIPTATCTRCHYGDASIGLHYRGLAQLVPGQPAGPEVPGTTASLLNGVFYNQDAGMTPPDVHHAKGLHCIDCHTAKDTMGDGNLWPQMDHAVEIECTSCHGTFTRVTDLTTSRGRRVNNLTRDGDRFYLVSKVTGQRHQVTQVAHLLDPKRPEYNARAAAAMTPEHARLECYACHSAWNVNFFGFHFDRNEQFTQLDLLSGERTPGRVTTQEKVFATFNQLRLGFNHEGQIAPLMVGFSTLGSAHGRDGETLLRQAIPQTQAKLNGVTMVPHQPHSTRSETRTCVECHRTPATYGMGSSNFRLAREFGFAVNAQGLWTVALDTKTPARTAVVADLPLEGEPVALALRLDATVARASHAFVAGADGSLAVVSLANPVLPRLLSRKKLLGAPRQLLAQGDLLYAADGPGGVAIFDISNPTVPRLLAVLPTTDAHAVQLAFPWLLVADGAGGLVIADVAEPAATRFVASVDLNGENSAPNEAVALAVLFQYSRTVKGRSERLARTRARHLAYIACGLDGVRIVDWSEPEAPVVLGSEARALRFARGDVRGIAINTVFDLGSSGGGLRSGEHEALYVHSIEGEDQNRLSYLRVFDATDPLRPRAQPKGTVLLAQGAVRLQMLRAYNAPFLQHWVVAAGAGGLGTLVDASKPPTATEIIAVWEGVQGLRDLAIEELALDRLQSESGSWIMDISHPDCRYLTPDEVLRVLRAPLPLEAEARGRYRETRPAPDGSSERKTDGNNDGKERR